MNGSDGRFSATRPGCRCLAVLGGRWWTYATRVRSTRRRTVERAMCASHVRSVTLLSWQRATRARHMCKCQRHVTAYTRGRASPVTVTEGSDARSLCAQFFAYPCSRVPQWLLKPLCLIGTLATLWRRECAGHLFESQLQRTDGREKVRKSFRKSRSRATFRRRTRWATPHSSSGSAQAHARTTMMYDTDDRRSGHAAALGRK